MSNTRTEEISEHSLGRGTSLKQAHEQNKDDRTIIRVYTNTEEAIDDPYPLSSF